MLDFHETHHGSSYKKLSSVRFMKIGAEKDMAY